MHVAIYLPLLAAAVLGGCAPRLSRGLPPATATRLLATAGALIAAATSFVLAVLAFTLVAELAPVARLGSWSASALDAANPVPDFTSAAAATAVCVLAVAAVRAAARRVRATLAARRLCATLGGGPGDLVIVDGPDVEAFALPAMRGRIVASRPLLAALPADERRAVLAHETAHLRHHHHTYRLAAELSAAVNPLLRPWSTPWSTPPNGGPTRLRPGRSVTAESWPGHSRAAGWRRPSPADRARGRRPPCTP